MFPHSGLIRAQTPQSTDASALLATKFQPEYWRKHLPSQLQWSLLCAILSWLPPFKSLHKYVCGAWVLSQPEFMQAGIFLEVHSSWVFRPGFIACPCHWPTNNKCIFEIVWVEIQGCTIEQTHSVPLGELQSSDSLNLDISSLYNLKNHRVTRAGMDLRSQHWILSAELYSRREKPNQSGEADFRVTEHKAGDIKYQSGSPQCRLSLIQTRVWFCECLP